MRYFWQNAILGKEKNQFLRHITKQYRHIKTFICFVLLCSHSTVYMQVQNTHEVSVASIVKSGWGNKICMHDGIVNLFSYSK